MSDANNPTTVESTSKKRSYDAAFDEALVRFMDRPRPLELTKQQWEAELRQDDIEIKLYDLLVNLVFIKSGTEAAAALAAEPTIHGHNLYGPGDSIILIAKEENSLTVRMIWEG